MTAAMLAVALAAQAQDPGAGGGRPCVVVIDSVGGTYREVAVGPQKNTFAGGGILVHCRGTGTRVSSDSMAHYAGPNRLDLIGHVVIRDTALALDATTAQYFLSQERLEAHRQVVATNRRTGTVLRGPNVTYLRAVVGVRDTTEMFASGRPTIDYHSSAADSSEPYVIVADRVRFKGDDRFWGGGRVTIDRSDFAARGDSVMLDERSGVGLLLGKPSIEGKGANTYTLAGRRIELALAGRDVRLAKALGAGSAVASDWRLTADTIHLAVETKKVQQVFAWGDSSKPLAISTKSTVRADSLALDTPDQVLKQVRAYGHARSTSARDSTADSSVRDNWIEGDTLVADFVSSADTAGKRSSRIKTVVASGAARSLMHLKKGTDQPCWSRNYSRGRKIAVTLAGDSLDNVVVSGAADGAHLECFAARPDTAADSTATTRPSP